CFPGVCGAQGLGPAGAGGRRVWFFGVLSPHQGAVVVGVFIAGQRKVPVVSAPAPVGRAGPGREAPPAVRPPGPPQSGVGRQRLRRRSPTQGGSCGPWWSWSA